MHENFGGCSMDCTILQFIIVCPMVFLAGFVDAIAGGGGLISLPAYLIAGGSDPYGARNQQNEFHDGNGNRDRAVCQKRLHTV